LIVYGDGEQTRPFCYVSDTVTGLMLLTTSETVRGEVVNVGNSKEKTILDLAKKIKELTKSGSELSFHSLPKNDPKRRCPDMVKMEKLLGWKPKIGLDLGLKRTIELFRR
jgi:nucleoside-diphosphate-sugar epimerase